MAGAYCYYPVAGYGQVAETVGIVAQTAATAYQLYLQRLMAKQAEHQAAREGAAAQQQAAATAAAQAKAATVVQQQAALAAGESPGLPRWALPVGLGVLGVGAVLFLGRRRR